MKINYPAWSVLLTAGTLVAFGQETSPAANEATLATPPAAASTSVAAGEADGLTKITSQEPAPATKPLSPEAPKETLSVDFPDEDVRNVVRNVADLYDLNIIIPDTLQGRVSVKLKDVTWRQLFKVVLTPAGYTFIEEANIVKIVNQANLDSEPPTSEMIKLNSISPQLLADALKTFLNDAAGEKLQAVPGTNFVVITATPSRQIKLRETIEKLDDPSASKATLDENAIRQILIETKFIEVNTGNAKNIGVNWTSLQNYQVGASGLNQGFQRNRGKDTGATGDTTNTNQNSTNFVFPNGGAPTTTSGNLDSQNLTSNFNRTGDTSRITTALFSASDFNLILSALQSDSKSRLISNPTLVTYNGRESTLHVGEEIPVSGGGSATSNGGSQKNPAKREKAGIILNFIPNIITVRQPNTTPTKSYEAVKLDLSKPSSKVKIEDAAGGIILRNQTREKLVDGNLEPVFSTRSVATEVVLKDGYTMGIGGMIESNDSKGNTSVPLLGSIPGLGALFRSKTNDLTSRNLVVFVTAKILNPAETSSQYSERLAKEAVEAKQSDFVARASINPKLIKQMEIQRSDLPGFKETEETPFYLPPPPTAREIKAAQKAAQKAKAKADKEEAARNELSK
jgi:type IV pilus assembly protein PilQ